MEKKVAIPAVLGELSPAKRRYSEKRGDLTRDFAPINWVDQWKLEWKMAACSPTRRH